MCVYIYIYMYTHIHTYEHIVCMYVRTYVRMYVCMYVCMYPRHTNKSSEDLLGVHALDVLAPRFSLRPARGKEPWAAI